MPGAGGVVVDWVGIEIGKKRNKNTRQSPNILNKALTRRNVAKEKHIKYKEKTNMRESP